MFEHRVDDVLVRTPSTAYRPTHVVEWTMNDETVPRVYTSSIAVNRLVASRPTPCARYGRSETSI